MTRPDYLGPYPDLYVGGQRLWKVFAGDKQVWPDQEESFWVYYRYPTSANGSLRIYYSTGGEIWDEVVIGTRSEGASYSQHCIDVDPETGTFAALDNRNNLLVSSDGINWSSVNMFGSGIIARSIAYGGGYWNIGAGWTGVGTDLAISVMSSDLTNFTLNYLPLFLGSLGDLFEVSGYSRGSRILAGFRQARRSTNDWSTSSQLTGLGSGQNQAMASNGEGTIVYARGSTGVNFYRSTNDGATWSLASSFAPADGWNQDRLTTSLRYGGGVLLATNNYSNDTDRWVWRSTDNASTWGYIGGNVPGASIPPFGFRVPQRLAYDFPTQTWLMAGRKSSGGVDTACFWKSKDNGDTWEGPFDTDLVPDCSGLISRSGLPDTKLP